MEVLRGWQVSRIDSYHVILDSVGTPIEMFVEDKKTTANDLDLAWKNVAFALTGRSDIRLCGKRYNYSGGDQTSTFGSIGCFHYLDKICVGLKSTENFGWYAWGPGSETEVTFGEGTGYGLKGIPTYTYGARITGSDGKEMTITVPKLYFTTDGYDYWWYGPANSSNAYLTNRVEGQIFVDTGKSSYVCPVLTNLKSGWGLSVTLPSTLGTSGEKSNHYGTFEGWEII